MILTFEGTEGFEFPRGSLFVLGASLCWGLENNCTRKISGRSTYQIVTVKGLCSGTGAMITALIAGEIIPEGRYICLALILGFVAYGLSIFIYIRAQNIIGAAKTGAYYAAAPFIGAFLSFIMLHESLSANYIFALIVMIFGSIFAVRDTLRKIHTHEHTHIIFHSHGGIIHSHLITHSHEHRHYMTEKNHVHKHKTD